MAKKLVFALLLSVMLTLGVSNSKTTIQVVDLVSTEDNVKVGVDTSGAGVQAATFPGLFGFFGWGPPYPWWPDRFCSWDYWTSAAWQITLVGKFARCSDATGVALAGLASRTVSNDRKIQAVLKGVIWKPLTAAPVLCAQTKTGQVTYTVRMQAPGPAFARIRTSSGNQLMQTSVFTATSVKSLKLSGLGFSKAEWIQAFWCNSRGCAKPPANSRITGVSGGTFTCNTPITAGSNCSFTCTSGFPLPGTAPICQAGGGWANAAAGPPQCVECVIDSNCPGGGTCQSNVCIPAASECADPPPDSDITGPFGGTFNCTVPATIGSNCTFTCTAPGFVDPDTFPVCEAGGTWANGAGGAPACVECLEDGNCDPNFLQTCVNGACQQGNCTSFAVACQTTGNLCAGGTTPLEVPICPGSARPFCDNNEIDCPTPAPIQCNGAGCDTCDGYCQVVASYVGSLCVDTSNPPICITCFPATSTVQMRGGYTKTMEQLQSGDEVLAVDPSTGELTYTTMYLDSHCNSTSSVDYLAITTSPSNATIKMSADHFMYRQVVAKVGSNAGTTAGWWSAAADTWASLFHAQVGIYNAEIIKAGKVRAGDVVFITKLNGQAHSATIVESLPLVAETVTSVVFVKERGNHAPKTHTGNIVVDGVLAHCQTATAFRATLGQSHYVRRAFALLPDATLGWLGQKVGMYPILRWLHGTVPDWFQTRVVAVSAEVGGYTELPLAKRYSLVAEGVSLALGRTLREFVVAFLKPVEAVSYPSPNGRDVSVPNAAELGLLQATLPTY